MWVKSIAIGKSDAGNTCSNLLGHIAVGHFQPISSDRYLSGCHENILVADPFCGLGSTAIACKRLGVSFVGFEIDKD